MKIVELVPLKVSKSVYIMPLISENINCNLAQLCRLISDICVQFDQ